MARYEKGAVRPGQGVMCNICGRNCGKGGALKKHVEGIHQVGYHEYKRCFYGGVKTIISDGWDDSVSTNRRGHGYHTRSCTPFRWRSGSSRCNSVRSDSGLSGIAATSGLNPDNSNMFASTVLTYCTVASHWCQNS